ncbi:hypothetical protein D3C77_291710 [compost metagenome]
MSDSELPDDESQVFVQHIIDIASYCGSVPARVFIHMNREHCIFKRVSIEHLSSVVKNRLRILPPASGIDHDGVFDASVSELWNN